MKITRNQKQCLLWGTAIPAGPIALYHENTLPYLHTLFRKSHVEKTRKLRLASVWDQSSVKARNLPVATTCHEEFMQRKLPVKILANFLDTLRVSRLGEVSVKTTWIAIQHVLATTQVLPRSGPHWRWNAFMTALFYLHEVKEDKRKIDFYSASLCRGGQTQCQNLKSLVVKSQIRDTKSSKTKSNHKTLTNP